MKVLITGAAGFVGRHLHAALADHDVHTCDIARGTDAMDLFRHPQFDRYDLVLHAAARVGGRKNIDGRPLSLVGNLALDAEMFAWAVRSQPRHVVYFSSSAVYPVSMQTGRPPLELDEDAVVFGDTAPQLIGMPDQLYGWTKLTGELLAERFRREGLSVSVVRPFSGYGEDQAADYPFTAFRNRAQNRVNPFVVWGDGNQVRDFIHIDDIVRATLLIAHERIPGPVNLGTGIPTSMIELAQRFVGAARFRTTIKPQTQAPSGVRYRVADPQRLLAIYEPQISLDEGIRRALAVA